jgi:predicted transcriptional regulator YheO
MKNKPVPKTQFALRLQAAMDQENMSLHEAALKFHMSYEYMRRLTLGINNPSSPLLTLLCMHFNWNFDEMEKMIVDDRFRTKYGVHGAIAQQFNPEVEPFEKGWFLLTKTQKEFLLAQFNLYLEQNRRSTRGGKRVNGEEGAA